jgi:hypothetical protein
MAQGNLAAPPTNPKEANYGNAHCSIATNT